MEKTDERLAAFIDKLQEAGCHYATELCSIHGVYNENVPTIPQIENLDTIILAAIGAGGELDMRMWHGPKNHWCGSNHCRAGWAVHEAGKEGKALQDSVGVATAASLIYKASYPDLPVPDFRCGDEEALKDIKARAALDDV